MFDQHQETPTHEQANEAELVPAESPQDHVAEDQASPGTDGSAPGEHGDQYEPVDIGPILTAITDAIKALSDSPTQATVKTLTLRSSSAADPAGISGATGPLLADQRAAIRLPGGRAFLVGTRDALEAWLGGRYEVEESEMPDGPASAAAITTDPDKNPFAESDARGLELATALAAAISPLVDTNGHPVVEARKKIG